MPRPPADVQQLMYRIDRYAAIFNKIDDTSVVEKRKARADLQGALLKLRTRQKDRLVKETKAVNRVERSSTKRR